MSSGEAHIGESGSPSVVRTDGARWVRPRQRSGLEAYAVAEEMVVLPPDGARVYALNESGKEVFAHDASSLATRSA